MSQDRGECSVTEPRNTGLGAPLVAPLAPEYRRCVVYVLIALVGLPFVARWVNEARPPEHRPDLRVLGAVDALLVLGVASVLRWRLRVDERGISRRRFVAWHLYSWDEFASGRVREGVYRDTYQFPDRPPWHRALSLGPLRDADRSAIKAIIERVWVRPPAPDPPANLAFRFSFRKIAYIEPVCLTIVHRGEEQRYAWGEVRALKIRRSERERRDFSSLELVLPDRTITLRVAIDHGRAIPSWSGLRGQPRPDPATVAAALQEYVPRARIVVTSLSEPPANWAEWDDRRAVFRGKTKELNDVRRIMWAFGAVSLVVCLCDNSRGWASVVPMLIFCVVTWGLVWLVFRYIAIEHWRAIEELESQLPARPAVTTTTRAAGKRPW